MIDHEVDLIYNQLDYIEAIELHIYLISLFSLGKFSQYIYFQSIISIL